MPDKKICPLMSAARQETASTFQKYAPVECLHDGCALWDPLLKCCSHVSPLVEGRVNIREIVAGLVAGFEDSAFVATEKLVEAEERLTEIVNAPELDGEAAAKAQERIGELKGKIDVIGQICAHLRRRFML